MRMVRFYQTSFQVMPRLGEAGGEEPGSGGRYRQWDALKPWQRPVASLLVILSAIGFFIALGTLILEVNA
ncbi:MAG TPA: hypothetical protein VEZ71_18155 [Archangium sp.]|nr:hypothetical protein [Archangium sp.]